MATNKGGREIGPSGRFPDEQSKEGSSKSGKRVYNAGFTQQPYAPDQGHWTPESYNSIPVKDQPHPNIGSDIGQGEY